MEFFTLHQLLPQTDEFYFHPLLADDEEGALVICNPMEAFCRAPTVLHSRKTLEEHIHLIQSRKLTKALVVAEDIGFLRQCPSLEAVWVVPSSTKRTFDFSPLYDLPNLRWLHCETVFGPKDSYWAEVDYSRLSNLETLQAVGPRGHKNIRMLKAVKSLSLAEGLPAKDSYWAEVDYSRLSNLETLQAVGPRGHKNIRMLKAVKSLSLAEGLPAGDSLEDLLPYGSLEELTICQAPIRSLSGLHHAVGLKHLGLICNRRLEDISQLSGVAGSLQSLTVDTCGKIKDFSVLSCLEKLDTLVLQGSNALPNLDFLKRMPNLQSFVCKMNVLNGDLSLCLSIPNVSIQNRKHYNYKNRDFSKK